MSSSEHPAAMRGGGQSAAARATARHERALTLLGIAERTGEGVARERAAEAFAALAKPVPTMPHFVRAGTGSGAPH